MYARPLLSLSLLCAACSGLPPMPPLVLTTPLPAPAVGSEEQGQTQTTTATNVAAQSAPAVRTLQWHQTPEQRALAADTVQQRLAEPLDAERAVDIALIHNPLLQSRLAELGIGLADLEQARRLPNPGFSFERIRTSEGLDIERGLHFNLARLIFYPQLRGIEAKRFEQTRLLTLQEAYSVANRTRRAFYEAVAARQKLAYATQVKDTADAASELAKRLEKAGNYNPLSRAREQAFAIDAEQALTRARQQESATRIRLLRLLGLPASHAQLRLPDRLPALPEQLRDSSDIRRIGINQRLDVQAAQQEALRTADQLGLSKVSRFITLTELGGLRETGPGGEVKRGIEVALTLPIFDSGDARVARAQATYDRAVSRVQAAVIEADGDIQLALDAWRMNWELARRQRDETVPLRKRITDETLLRYNGMIGSVFELLAESRAQVNSVSAYIDLLRDYWMADADLTLSLLGRPALGLNATPHGGGAVSPEAAAAAAAGAPHGPGGH